MKLIKAASLSHPCYQRILEWLGLEGTSKISLFQLGCQSLHQEPAQSAQGAIQPGCEQLQEWGTHDFFMRCMADWL